MRVTQLFSCLVLTLILTSCNSKKTKETKMQDLSVSKIEIIDFHSTHRCITCNGIENNAKYTLQTYFAKELKTGKITFQSVNVDEKENEKLAEKFQASGTSLFLNIIKKGKENQINLTDFAFMNARDKEKFSTELKLKVEKELADL